MRPRRVALIALATATLLLVLEGAARVAAHAAGRPRGLGLDPVLGWRPLPDVEKRGAWWGRERAARTNALGWRDAPRAVAKPAGVRRAVLLGDSFVFGVNVDDGERVSEHLEREVPGLEAWNLGVTAYGPDQELLVLETLVPEYAPDLVVWFVCLSNDVEDLRHRVRYGWAKPWFGPPAAGAWRRHAPEPGALARLRDASYLVEFALAPLDGRRVAHRLAPDWEDPRADALQLLGAIAGRMRARAAELGAQFLCVVIPSDLQESEPRAADTRAVEALRTCGLDPVLLRPAFAAAIGAGKGVLQADGHWTAPGHALAAHLVAAELRARALVR